jgi:hypothetical protein
MCHKIVVMQAESVNQGLYHILKMVQLHLLDKFDIYTTSF